MNFLSLIEVVLSALSLSFSLSFYLSLYLIFIDIGDRLDYFNNINIYLFSITLLTTFILRRSRSRGQSV